MTEASLRGARVLVPVTPTRKDFARRLASAGVDVAPAEFIAVVPSRNHTRLAQAVVQWCEGDYQWLVVTSRNAVDALAATASTLGKVLSAPQPRAQVAAVGEGTRAQCEDAGLTVSVVPRAKWDGRTLVDEFPHGTGKVLAPLGNLAPSVLADGLAAKGWHLDVVEAYRTVAGAGIAPHVRDELVHGGFDAVVLTSGSVANRFAQTVPQLASRTRVVVIGDTTHAAARTAGIDVHAVADEPSYDAVVRALIDVLSASREGSP